MTQRAKRTRLPLLLLLCCAVLMGYLCLLVATQPSPRTLLTKDQLPATIYLTHSSYIFATASASLMSGQSSREYFRQSEIGSRLLFALFSPQPPIHNPFDPSLVSDWISRIELQVNTPTRAPAVIWKSATEFVIDPGTMGAAVDRETIISSLLTLPIDATNSARLPLISTGKSLSPDAILEAERFVRKLLGKTLTIQTQKAKQTLSTRELIGLIDLPTDFSTTAYHSLLQTHAPALEHPPQEPVLDVQAGEVIKFVAPRDGIGIDRDAFKDILFQQVRLLADARSLPAIEVPVTHIAPKKTLAQVNTLGISDRIGLGESEYHHSIPNRIHNVSLTTTKIHAKLIQPGEVFSFNKYLGEVSARTGFKQAYIIKEGQTILGDGGGVCQVSSTLFRSLLTAGLPITERKGHSYRVGYYEQNSRPGFDATVYSPHPDLRFVNDTNSPIIINAVADPKTTRMYVELWGKSDGRKAEVKNYRQWGAQPAPPARYQDDPTLKPGQIKQVEYAAPGLKTSFDYVVTYPNGEVKEKSFSTNYIPWAAVYLRGI